MHSDSSVNRSDVQSGLHQVELIQHGLFTTVYKIDYTMEALGFNARPSPSMPFILY